MKLYINYENRMNIYWCSPLLLSLLLWCCVLMALIHRTNVKQLNG